MGRRPRQPPRFCSVPGCEDRHKAYGLCNVHYTRWKNHGDVNWEPVKPPRFCNIPDCPNPHKAKGLCEQHYHRVYRLIHGQSRNPVRGNSGRGKWFMLEDYCQYERILTREELQTALANERKRIDRRNKGKAA